MTIDLEITVSYIIKGDETMDINKKLELLRNERELVRIYMWGLKEDKDIDKFISSIELMFKNTDDMIYPETLSDTIGGYNE